MPLRARRGNRHKAERHDEYQDQRQQCRIGSAQAGERQRGERAGAVRLAMLALTAMRLPVSGDHDLLGQMPALRVGAYLDSQDAIDPADHVTRRNQRFHAERSHDQDRGQSAMARKKGAEQVHCAAAHRPMCFVCHPDIASCRLTHPMTTRT